MPQALGGGRLGGGAEEDHVFYSQRVGPLRVAPMFCLHFRRPFCWESVGWEPRDEALSPSRRERLAGGGLVRVAAAERGVCLWPRGRGH